MYVWVRLVRLGLVLSSVIAIHKQCQSWTLIPLNNEHTLSWNWHDCGRNEIGHVAGWQILGLFPGALSRRRVSATHMRIGHPIGRSDLTTGALILIFYTWIWTYWFLLYITHWCTNFNYNRMNFLTFYCTMYVLSMYVFLCMVVFIFDVLCQKGHK